MLKRAVRGTHDDRLKPLEFIPHILCEADTSAYTKMAAVFRPKRWSSLVSAIS
jgi:hypothetical protein